MVKCSIIYKNNYIVVIIKLICKNIYILVLQSNFELILNNYKMFNIIYLGSSHLFDIAHL